VRHDETLCTGTDQNRPEQTETLRVKTGAHQSGPKRTEAHSPLSGPRYRGSNPCLPATLSRIRSVAWLLGPDLGFDQLATLAALGTNLCLPAKLIRKANRVST
jgi:hypothetical protein